MRVSDGGTKHRQGSEEMRVSEGYQKHRDGSEEMRVSEKQQQQQQQRRKHRWGLIGIIDWPTHSTLHSHIVCLHPQYNANTRVYNLGVRAIT